MTLTELSNTINTGWKQAAIECQRSNDDILHGIQAWNTYRKQVDTELAALIEFVGRVANASHPGVVQYNNAATEADELSAMKYDSIQLNILTIAACGIIEHLKEVL